MKQYINVLIDSILAGIMIGVGGTVFLAADNKVIGASLFSIGLFAICFLGQSLFTGKIGYLRSYKPIYLVELALIWVGNFIGTWLVGTLLHYTRQVTLVEKAQALCNIKVSDKLLSIFILGIFCGVLMFIAVEVYKTNRETPLHGCIAIFLCVVVFILSGFEHCVADMFYFSIANMWSMETLFVVLSATLGNAVGGILFWTLLHKKWRGLPAG